MYKFICIYIYIYVYIYIYIYKRQKVIDDVRSINYYHKGIPKKIVR